MDVAELAAQARAAAEAEVAEETSEEKELLPLDEYIELMAESSPESTVEAGDYNEYSTVPGFNTLTLGICTMYDVSWKWLKFLIALKKSGEVYEPHILSTSHGIHIIRGFSRREWSTIQRDIINLTKTRMSLHIQQESDPRWVEADLQMCTEEVIACKGCVKPDYTAETVRSLPTGMVSYLANAILRSSGHEEQQLPPIALR